MLPHCLVPAWNLRGASGMALGEATFFGQTLSCLRKNALFCVGIELETLNIFIEMKNYIGIAAIVLGALILVISYFTNTLVDYNWVQILALLFIVAGIVGHIIVTKRPS